MNSPKQPAWWRRFIPDVDDVKKMRGLGFLANHLTHPMIFGFNRRSVARATFFGIICAMIPFPVQVISGIICASVFRANLAVIVGWIFTTNPLTIPFVFYGAYQIGASLMGVPISVDEAITLDWIWQHYKPVWLGATIMGFVGGFVGYFLVHYFWRRSVLKRWKARQLARANQSLR